MLLPFWFFLQSAKQYGEDAGQRLADAEETIKQEVNEIQEVSMPFLFTAFRNQQIKILSTFRLEGPSHYLSLPKMLKDFDF